MRWTNRILLAAAVAALAATAPAMAANGKTKKDAAAKPAPAAPAVDDLSVAVVRHVASCPPPKSAPCVIRKPVDVGYRVLSAAVDLDDRGEYWIGDFARSREPVGTRTLLRVIGRDGDLHEVEVSFSQAAQPKAAAPRQK